MKRNEEEDKKKPLISLLYKSIRPYLSHSLSLSASSAPALLYLCTRTHTEHTTKSLSFCPIEERVVLVRKRMFLQIRVKKMQKSFRSRPLSKGGSSLLSLAQRKKRSPFFLFFNANFKADLAIF